MSVSLCVLRIEIDEDLPEMGDNTSEMGKKYSSDRFTQELIGSLVAKSSDKQCNSCINVNESRKNIDVNSTWCLL